VLQKCWQEHDKDAVRNAGRRLVKARKRLAKAESHHKKLKAPDSASRLELDSALRSVAELEQLAKQAASDMPLTVDSGGFSEQEGSRFIQYIDFVMESTAADRGHSPHARILGMLSMLNDRPDGTFVADLFWRLLHDQPFLARVLKASVSEDLPDRPSKAVVMGGIHGTN
jgi:hypothetical protein